VARIQRCDLLLSEPLTTFEPKPPAGNSTAQRQRAATLVHCRLPLPNLTDLGMASLIRPPAAPDLSDAVVVPENGDHQMRGGLADVFSYPVDENLLRLDPLEWSAQLLGMDF